MFAKLSKDLAKKGRSSSVIIVGGGIIGTMHAWLALEAGHEVTHIERGILPRSASVRNFGLVWVSGREAGKELDLAIRARELWGDIGSRAEIGFRANGSLTIATNEEEWAILQEAIEMPDAKKRGFELLTRDHVHSLEPVLAGDYFGALRCTLDAAVEPPFLLAGLRREMAKNSKYTWVPGCEIVKYKVRESGHSVKSSDGQKFSADRIVFVPGSEHKGFLADYFEGAPIRRVRLQMGATVPLAQRLSHSIADGDSLRYYPAFKNLSLHTLPSQSEVATALKMQLLLVQRADGSCTIGDTHEYDEPFDHELAEAPYEHLRSVITKIFGVEAPQIERRWDGVYSQSTSKDIYFRKEIEPGAVIVTGGGGRGNSLAPAIAEETIRSWQK